MASDDTYSAFLKQANQDTGAGDVSTQSAFRATKAIDTDVPPAILQINKYYTSETDAPFEPVSLSWSKNTLPNEDEFKDLIDHSAEVFIMDVKQFDPKGQYRDVLDTVASAANGGQRKAYRVLHGKTRVEYYIVALDLDHSRLVGVKARAVET